MILKKILKKIQNIFMFEKLTPVQIQVFDGDFLSDHYALIIGGSGGIGYAIAARFVSQKCKVVLAGRNQEKLENACERLGKDSSRYLILDLMDISSLREIGKKASSLFGDEVKIDILVNSAGVHGPSSVWDVTDKDWDTVMNINLKGMYFACQEIGNYMKINNISGHILNISSASALKPGKTPYEISKAGVKSLTLGLASEFIQYGIVVNCLAPGPTATPMLNKTPDSTISWNGNPSKRMATPDEIANWAVYMVSNIGNYVVGDTFYVTGGSGTICIDK